MNADQESAMLGLLKDREVNKPAFLNDTELMLEMVVGDWYKTKEDLDPVLNRLRKAVKGVLSDPEAALHVALCLQLKGSDTQSLEVLDKALELEYHQLPRTHHREEIVHQARQVFKKHDLPIATGENSLFVKYLEQVTEIADLPYDGRAMARQFK